MRKIRKVRDKVLKHSNIKSKGGQDFKNEGVKQGQIIQFK